MNNLRIPIIILVIVVIALGAWFFFVHQNITPSPVPSAVDSTSSPQATSASNPVLDPATVAANAVGTWQSTDDPNYTVVITADGKWTDNYKTANASDDISESGTYLLFTSADPDPDFTDTIVPGIVYVKLTEGSDVYYYSVLEADASNLQLSYLARGNTLSFTKVQ